MDLLNLSVQAGQGEAACHRGREAADSRALEALRRQPLLNQDPAKLPLARPAEEADPAATMARHVRSCERPVVVRAVTDWHRSATERAPSDPLGYVINNGRERGGSPET